MGSSAYYCPCGAQWHRYLPPSLVRVDDTTLFSRRSSLTLSSLSSPPVLCVQRRLTAVDGTPLEIQDIPLPRRWSQLPPEPLLLTAGAWLLTAASLPD